MTLVVGSPLNLNKQTNNSHPVLSCVAPMAWLAHLEVLALGPDGAVGPGDQRVLHQVGGQQLLGDVVLPGHGASEQRRRQTQDGGVGGDGDRCAADRVKMLRYSGPGLAAKIWRLMSDVQGGLVDIGRETDAPGREKMCRS